MSPWNTHDRDTDHHGTQDDTTVVLSSAVYYLYAYGDDSYIYGYGDNLLPYAYGEEGDTLHEALVNVATIIGPSVPSLGLLPRYASEPHAGLEVEGESYYDTTLHKARTWNGSAWQDWW
jgi:hypothetical protein